MDSLTISTHQVLPQKQLVDSKHSGKGVIVIAGPTAVGKSSLAIKLAKLCGGEIVSADAFQVYRGMDIGTNKGSLIELTEVPHHLINICDIHEPYNIMKFYNDAMEAIRLIFDRQAIPIVVGGNGFYIQSLMQGPPQGPSSDQAVRQSLEKDTDNFGAELMYQKLKEIDPEYAKTITLRDRQKIIRGLEIITLSNKKVSDFMRHSAEPSPYRFHCWSLNCTKSVLFKKIEERCQAMLEQGLIDEVKSLMEKGLEGNQTAKNAIGYRQAIQYLHSEQSSNDYETFNKQFVKSTKQYVKKQITWFKKQKQFRHVDIGSLGDDKIIEWIIREYEQSEPI